MEIIKFVIGGVEFRLCNRYPMCMAIHKRLHIADPEVGELAERLSRLMGKNKTESLRLVLREKVESLGRARTAQQRNRAILQLVDQKLATAPAPLTKQEIEEIVESF